MDEHQRIFEQAKRTATAIHETFGKNCEVVIHDLADLDRSLIFMAGNITGREPGAPITDMVVKELNRDGHLARDSHNYRTTTQDGRIVKSSSVYLRDIEGSIIGCLCINFDITRFLEAQSLLTAFTAFSEQEDADKRETFAASVGDTVDAMVEEAIRAMGRRPPTMTKQEKVQLVQSLDRQGFFMIKGAVEQLARILGVSKFTIYNYLQEGRTDQEMRVL